MEVMGVSVIRRLVVPRFAAAIMIGVALTGVIVFRRLPGQLPVQRRTSRTAHPAASSPTSPRSPPLTT